MDKIQVPRPVFEGLEAIRQSGAVNMFDYGSVLRMVDMLNHKDAARWLRDHKREYLQGFTALSRKNENYGRCFNHAI